MRAMVTMGHGGFEQIHWREDWPRPDPGPGEVLIKVGACGLNNTDINTRIGWYSRSVTGATDDAGPPEDTDPSWGGAAIAFPRIQGADIAGRIVAVGPGVDAARVGQRVISDCWLRSDPHDIEQAGYVGSECDGGFAEYVVLPSANALEVKSDLSDAELATFSCSYSTAEGMLTRTGVGPEDSVLVTGASGGVGGALVQLAKRRGARIIALAAPSKKAAVAALGADLVLPRDPGRALADERITVLADVVGGPKWADLLEHLARGGRYVCSGAIAGPMVALDLRRLYLRDLTFHGSTVLGPEVMQRLVGYIEAGEIQPALAGTYPLSDLPAAQRAFLDKRHTGNLVVVT